MQPSRGIILRQHGRQCRWRRGSGTDLLRRPLHLVSPMNSRVRAEWDQPGSDWEHRGVAGRRFGYMGLILTVVFVFLTIISPDQFGIEWASYHSLTFLGG